VEVYMIFSVHFSSNFLGVGALCVIQQVSFLKVTNAWSRYRLPVH